MLHLVPHLLQTSGPPSPWPHSHGERTLGPSAMLHAEARYAPGRWAAAPGRKAPGLSTWTAAQTGGRAPPTEEDAGGCCSVVPASIDTVQTIRCSRSPPHRKQSTHTAQRSKHSTAAAARGETAACTGSLLRAAAPDVSIETCTTAVMQGRAGPVHITQCNRTQ